MRDRPRILVVDDAEVLRRATVRLLGSAGYDVDEVATGEAALRVARAQVPDVILLDVVLPDLNGVEVCRRMKAIPELAASQVILISAQATDSDVKAAGLEVGADDYVARPVPNRELLARVAAALRICEANEALRETEAQLRSIIQASPLPIFVLDPDGLVRTWNAAAEVLFGWTAPEVIGLPLLIVPAAKLDEFAGLRERVAGGETLRGVQIVRNRKDGTHLDLLLSAAPLIGADGQLWGIMAILQDITERQALTQSLQRERNLLARITETSPVGIAVVKASGEIEFVNTYLEGLFGLSWREMGQPRLAGKAWHITDIDDAAIGGEALPFTDVIASRSPVRDVQVAVRRPDGSETQLSVNGAPLFDAEGAVDRIVFAVQDVTEQVAAAQRTAQLNAILDAIRSIDRMLVRTADREHLVEQACQIMADSGVVDEAWILLQEGDADPHLVAAAGTPDRTVLAEQLATAEVRRCAVEAMRTGVIWGYWRASDAGDTEAHCGVAWSEAPDDRSGEDTILVAPLTHGGACYGVLGVKGGAAFAAIEENRSLLEDIAADIAFALRGLETAATAAAASAELQDQVARERDFQQRLQALLEVSNALVLTDSVDDLCRRAVELASRWLGFERIGIWLYDAADPGHLHGTFGIDEAGRLRDERGQVIDATPEVMDWVTRGDTSAIQIDDGDLFDDRRQAVGVGTWLRALLWNGDDFAGIISADNLLTGRTMTSRDGDLLSLLASNLSSLIVRKRTEVTLQTREAFYRTIFETTGAATLVVNRDLTISLANAESARLLGYSRDELEKGIDTREVIAPEHIDDVLNRHRLRHEGLAPPGPHEVSIITERGQQRDTLAYASLVPGTDQTVVSLLDITAQKAAVAQAQRHAAWQRALNEVIFDTTRAPDVSSLIESVLTHALSALDVEMGACRWLEQQLVVGLAPDALDLIDLVQMPAAESGRIVQVDDWRDPAVPWLEGIGPEMRSFDIGASLGIPVVDPRDQDPEQGASIAGGIIISTREPRAWTQEERELMAAIGHQLAVAGERLGLLNQIRRQAQELQLVLDTVPEGVALLGPDGTVMLANPVASTGFADLAGRPNVKQLQHLGDLSLDEVLAPPQGGPWHEVSAGERVYEVVAKPLAESDNLEGWVLVLRDVTVEQRRERELRQQERLAAVGRLAAGIAHDFNNIMAVIVLYAQMVAQQPDLTPRAKDQAGVIYSQAHRATDLIEQILDFSRSTPLERHDLELLPFLKEIIRLWERTLPENIEISLTYDADRYLVLADPTRLQQAFMNLATNARDAMPEGGIFKIRLSLQTEETVQVDNDAPQATSVGQLPDFTANDWVRVDFVDTGTGIPQALLNRVFEPFFTTKPPGQGTGLGLAQVYGIVKQHDGEVTLASAAGRGTTVSVYLPLRSELVHDDARPALARELTPGDGELVLVVEDNAVTRSTLVDVLESLGYRVVEAATGRAALQILDASGDEIQAILTDAIMPEMGGAQLVATLAAREDDHPVVILSGYMPPEEQADLRAHRNFVRWLTKPVDLHTISEAIDEALSRRSGRR